MKDQDRTLEISRAQRLGKLVHDARTDLSLSLRDVCNASELSIGFLSQLERGNVSEPGLFHVLKVLHFLGVPINQVLQIAGIVDTTPSAVLGKNVPQPLAQLAATGDVTFEELLMLGNIHLGEKRPATSEDYWFILESIRRSIHGSE